MGRSSNETAAPHKADYVQLNITRLMNSAGLCAAVTVGPGEGWGSGRTLRITPQLADADVSPQTLHRRKAMHLNEASVPLSYIQDSPGHVELSITLSLHARKVMRSV